jgi:methylmalonyl-CoA mutase N-terminal domain/subunit
VSKKQQERLAALRRRRDGAAVERALDRIRAAAGTDENMMPLLIDAVEAYATVGEICHVLRDQWGEYQEVRTI